VSIDEQHIALPKLYGAPAYARPVAPVAVSPKPFDPDDLPIEALQTDDERELASNLHARSWAPGGAIVAGDDGDGNGNGHATGAATDDGLRPRPLSLKTIAGRLIGGD
jgi:hypothetical protein